MQLNHFKNNALIQLINCKENWTVKSISDLFDGRLFCDIIQEVFPDTFELLQREGQIILNYEEQSKGEEISNNTDFASEDQEIAEKDAENETTVIKKAVQKSDTGSIESAVHDSESIFPSIPTNESVPEEVNSAARFEKTVSESAESVVIDGASNFDLVESAMHDSASSTEPSDIEIKLTLNRYKLIQYFIDVRYSLKSETVITFSECLKKNELELAKILIFVMSEVVQHYVRSNDPLIQLLSHVDSTVQQNLEQCFNFLINERKKITKSAIEKILTSNASNKITSSPNNSCIATPRRSCVSKYKRASPKETPPESQESIFTNSPLKTLFESPVFTKVDIISRDKEILKMKQILYEEESNSCTLQQKIQVLEKKLEEKDKEIRDFKERNRLLYENEVPEDCENCMKQKQIIEENERCIEKLKVDLKQLRDVGRERFEEKMFDYKMEVFQSVQELHHCVFDTKKQLIDTIDEMTKIKGEKSELEETVKKLLEELDEKNKELEVYKEKLSYTDIKIKKEYESSVFGECMGSYFQEENEKSLADASHVKLEAHTEEKSSVDATHVKLEVHTEEKSVNNVMVQCPEQKESIKPEVSLSELAVPNNLPDCENNQNSKKFTESSNACDVSVKQDTKQSICSFSKETSIAGNNFPTVVKESIGSLWVQYDSTISENENRNNNNHCSITNENIDHVVQNNNFVTEIENTDGDNGLTKALNILRKTECDLNQMSKHLSAVSKVSPGPNGSNGLGSLTLREFLEGLKKSLHRSVLCLSQAQEIQMQCQNNNSISKKTILEVGHNSEGVAFLKCFECSKVGKDSSNSTKETINQESSAFQEKTQELLSLNEKYKNILKTWTHKEKELENCKRKYIRLKEAYQESLRNTKEIELRYKRLENDLRGVSRRENDLKIEVKQLKNFIKTNLMPAVEDYKRIKALASKREKNMSDENTRLKDEIFFHMNQNEQLSSENEKLSSCIKYLEKELRESNVNKYYVPSTSSVSEENRSCKGIKDKDAVSDNNPKLDDSDDILKLQNTFSNLNEVISQDIENESMISCALQQKSFQSSLYLYNCDEEEFLNHSSLAAIHNGYENTDLDLSRMQELLRRNTLLPGHLQSHYAIENLPETPIEKNLPKHKLKAGNPKLDTIVHIGGKKRKVSEMEAQNQSNLFSTPLRKIKKKVKETPASWKKMWEYRRNQRSGNIKPKP